MSSSCEFWANRVVISLESLPFQESEEENPEIFAYQLVYFTDGLKKIEITGRNSKILLDLPAGLAVPVLLYPVAKGEELKPAGGIYPFNYDECSHQLAIKWSKGPLAAAAMKLAISNFDLRYFNLAKLEKYVEEKFSLNPWDWDQEHFLNLAITGQANYFDIKKKTNRNVELTLPEGEYFLDHSFSGSFIIENELLNINLYIGYNRIFNQDFSCLYHITVDDQESIIMKENLDENQY